MKAITDSGFDNSPGAYTLFVLLALALAFLIAVSPAAHHADGGPGTTKPPHVPPPVPAPTPCGDETGDHGGDLSAGDCGE
jgi:hypothetical protein